MMKRVGVGLAGLMTVAALAGCGGGSNNASSPYCDDIKPVQASILGLPNNTITQVQFTQLVAKIHAINAAAPSDVKGAWAVYVVAVDEFNIQLGQSGMTMDDMRTMQSGSMGGGHAMAVAMQAARSLGTVAFSQALDTIKAEVAKECSINLGG